MSRHKIYPNVNYTSIPMPLSNEKRQEPPRYYHQAQITFRQHLFSSKSVLARLLISFLPPLGSFAQPTTDFEGTTLSIFLLTVILFHRIGRLAFFPLTLPSLYVVLFTTFIFIISKLTKTHISYRELFCLCGYGLFGSTVTLMLTQISDRLFFPSLIVFTGLNSVRITLTLFFRTRIPALRFILGTPAAIIHMIFPIYLYYATKT